MADNKCISESARSATIAMLQRLDTCSQISRPVIQRTKYGKAIFENREFKSLNALAENFPGGAYRETKEKAGPLKVYGQRSMVDVFENAKFPDGTPFSHIYQATHEKRKGLPVIVISNERPNPAYVPTAPTSKKSTKKA